MKTTAVNPLIAKESARRFPGWMLVVLVVPPGVADGKERRHFLLPRTRRRAPHPEYASP